MQRIELNGSTIFLLPVVKGLVSHGKMVREEIERLTPEAVGISISKEELEGLSRKEDYSQYEMSYLEQVYEAHLQEFGEVSLPPPCYVEAFDYCTQNSIKLIPLDMNEETFSDVYCTKVSGIDMLRESAFSNRSYKKKFNHNSPEEFAIDWDRKVNKAKGFRELNQERERHMAEVIYKMTKQKKTIVAIVEVERVDGIVNILNNK